jgi:hypothetical protein
MKQHTGNENFQADQGTPKGHVDLSAFFFFLISKAEPLCWEPTRIVIPHTTLILLVVFHNHPYKKFMLQRNIYSIRRFQSKSVNYGRGIFKLNIWKQHDIMGHLTVVGHLTFICPFVIN